MLSVVQEILIRDSYRRLSLDEEGAGRLFYQTLFKMYPQVQPLFQGTEMMGQGRKLMQMVGAVVASLEDIGAVHKLLADLGRRHDGYGVRPEFYDYVGDAFITTLEIYFGDDFTPEIREAWLELYRQVVEMTLV